MDHKKHSFGFGSLIRDQWITDSAHKAYQDTLYKYFNTATTQSVKWRYDQGTQVYVSVYITAPTDMC